MTTTTTTKPPAPVEDPMPRRRLQVSIRCQGDDVGAIAVSLIEVINMLEAAERAASGLSRDLGQISHADGDTTRSYSIELDDDPTVTPQEYQARVRAWRARRTEAQADKPREQAAT
jgi:hypothetical protein